MGERGEILEQRKHLVHVSGKQCGWPRPAEAHRHPAGGGVKAAKEGECHHSSSGRDYGQLSTTTWCL